MSVYTILTGATATATTPSQGFGPIPGPGPNANIPAQTQAFELLVQGNGAVSATVQIVVTNDAEADKNPSGANWTAYGSTVTATGTNTATAVWGGTQPWRHYGAYLTAISGTNAAATVKMSA